jgi:hypothetical protein
MDPWLGYGDLGGPSITGKGDFIINMQQIPIHEKKSRLPENFFPITAHLPTLPEAHGLWV